MYFSSHVKQKVKRQRSRSCHVVSLQIPACPSTYVLNMSFSAWAIQRSSGVRGQGRVMLFLCSLQHGLELGGSTGHKVTGSSILYHLKYKILCIRDRKFWLCKISFLIKARLLLIDIPRLQIRNMHCMSFYQNIMLFNDICPTAAELL